MELGLKASAISCPRSLFRFFTRSFGNSVNTSCHTNCCPKTRSCFFARSLAWDSPFRSGRPPSSKLNSFFPISAVEKVATSVCRVSTNHSAYFSFLHPVRRFIRTTISIQYIPFFIHPVTECKHLLAFILTRICYFGCEELTYIPYSSCNSQSLAAC